MLACAVGEPGVVGHDGIEQAGTRQGQRGQSAPGCDAGDEAREHDDLVGAMAHGAIGRERRVPVKNHGSTPQRVDKWFRRLQLLSAGLYSLGHGGNDAQKTAGIIWLLLITAGHSNAAIGESLGLAEATVKSTFRRCWPSSARRNRVQAALLAQGLGMG